MTINTIIFPTLAAVALASILSHASSVSHADNGELKSDAARFVGFRQFDNWTKGPDTPNGETVLSSPPIDAGIAWDELIVSWNAHTPPRTGLKIEALGLYPDHMTKFYTLGLWSSDPGLAAFEKDAAPTGYPRESVNMQKDEDGDVQTDTLVLKRPCAQVELRITLTSAGESGGEQPHLKYLGLSFLNSHALRLAADPQKKRPAWGRVIDVPERAQGAYPHGAVICSATCTSMTLSYWGKAARRADLDVDVPAVVQGVYDGKWGGTGNWPFNTAFAGSMPGMRAYVSRFTSLSELEDWIEAGIPVICSVSYDALRGKPRGATESGHLVICVGFTSDGDAILNDPALNPIRGLRVRTPYPRKQFLAGWADSRNTVYLIYPENRKPPANRRKHWDQ